MDFVRCCLKFSKEIADNLLDEIRNEPQIQKQLAKKPNLYIPMLAVPSNIEGCIRNDITKIEVVIDPSKINDNFSVSKQIEDIDLRILLFLPNISKIDIITERGHIVYKRTFVSGSHESVSLQKIVDDSLETSEKFFIFTKTIEKAIKQDDEYKDIRLATAVPTDFSTFHIGNVYSYFPLMDTKSPINCVLHASYELGDHRNTINRSETNKQIFKEQLLFLTEIVTKLVQNKMYDIAYKIIVPTDFNANSQSFVSPFNKFELENFYLDLLTKQKILLTVNNRNISIEEYPCIIKNDFPSLFVGKYFDRILQPIYDDKFISFMEVLSNKVGIDIHIKENELLDSINKISDSWSVSQQVDVFIWWNIYYKNSLPNLLKTQDNRWIEYGMECYFLIGGFDTEGIPSWVKIPALHQDYQLELFSKSEKTSVIRTIRESDKESHISRIIYQRNIYPTIKFMYRDKNNIISTVNSSVDTFDKAVVFVKWLWKNYSQDSTWTPPGRTGSNIFKYNFPCIDDNCCLDSAKFYLGSEYNNNLAEKLFSNEFRAFPSCSVFSVSESELEEFMLFIKKFGVKDYPVILQQQVNPMANYKNEYYQMIKNSGGAGASSNITIEYYLPYINQLENILSKLSTAEIIEWIIKDNSLYSYLSNPFYSDNACIKYYGNLQQYYRQYTGRIKNYILEVFNETKWIKLGGTRFSPREVLSNFGSRNYKKFSAITPVIGRETLESIASKINQPYDLVYDVFTRFDFCNNVTDLSSEDFYGLMLKLPTIDFSISADLSRTIYRIIEQPSFSNIYTDSANKKRFFSEGQVLVKYYGNLQYYPANKAFLPSSKIISKKNVPIVEKGPRTNNSNFVKVFGCQEYHNEYTVIKESIAISESNDAFQKYFREFCKFAYAFSERNENIQRYARNLTITLVKEISVSENDVPININEEYICLRDTLSNWYITVFGSDFVKNTISEIIETIYSNIANTPGFDASKLGELFRSSEESDRLFLIKKEFGSLSVIDDINYQNEIKNNFTNTLKLVKSDLPIDSIEIDFENFSSIKNSPRIIALFIEIGIDISDFRNMGFVYEIDLAPFYRSELSSFIHNEQIRFKNALFARAQKDKTLQNNFIVTVNRFRQFAIANITNSVSFDYQEAVVSEFGEWRNNDAFISADEEYASNYEKMNPDRLFEDEIAHDQKAQQWIYFGQTDKFKIWLEKHQKQANQESERKEDPYSRFRSVVPKKTDVFYHQPHDTKNISKTKANGHTGAFTQSAEEKHRKNQKIFGNNGELLIYNLLCEKVGKEKVFPRSEAFVELGIIKPGQAISGEYDISYIGEDGVEYFCEIKTGDGKSFIISPGELKFAEDNADRYKLFLVYDLDNQNPTYSILPAKFWEDSRYRKNVIIERIEFQF